METKEINSKNKMMWKRPHKSSLEIQASNRTKILKALKEKRELTFTELLDLKIVSRGALNIHLKALFKNQDIEKRYSKTKDKIVYCLTDRTTAKIYVESWIEHLGLMGITYITRKTLKKPINPKYDFLSKLEQHLIPKKPKYLSWKQVLNYLDKDHWISADLT